MLLQVVNLEGPGLGTIRGLAVRPGAAIRAYLSGERRRIANPLKLALVCGALLVLAFVLARAPEERPEADQLDLTSVLQVVNFAAIPVFGLCSFPLLRSARLTLAEHLAVGYFIYAEAMLAQALYVALGAHRFYWPSQAFGVLATIYLVWAAGSAWRVKWWKAILVALLAVILTTLIANLMMSGVVRAHTWWVNRSGV